MAFQMKPNIYMFHRIKLEQEQYIPDIYYSRNMVHNIFNLYCFIDSLLKKGKQFGRIEQCMQSPQYFHLTFDDGYQEHLTLARKLKEKYLMSKEHVTFSINYGNSYAQEYTGMDVIYAALTNNNLNIIKSFLKIPESESDVKKIKKTLIQQPPERLKKIPDMIPGFRKIASDLFLVKEDIKKISELFNIACHGMTHRDLRKYIDASEAEILSAKNLLDHELNQEIKIFTYPEGKNNIQLQKVCKRCGFQLGLSISHLSENSFCVGRKII